MPNTDDSDVETISHVAVKLPPLWKNNIAVWFIRVEANFAVANITNDNTKYNHLLASIDPDSITAVTDLILNPPQTDKYKTLKDRLINEYSESQSQQIRKLLSELTLGDKKPSALLRQMKELAQNEVTDEFLKTLWLERLPTQTQAILSVSTAALSELATLADKINDVKPETAIYAVSKPSIDNSNVNEIHNLKEQIEKLNIQVSELTRNLTRNRQNSRGRSSYRRRSQSGNRTSRNNENQNQNYCFYHERFGNSAKKCREPCSFQVIQKN